MAKTKLSVLQSNVSRYVLKIQETWGVITHRKSKKRGQNNKMKKRFYHFQEFDKVEFQNTKFDKKRF